MDCVKIVTRNIFYKLLSSFRPLYDNFRDDHVVLRNLTRASGCVCFAENVVEAVLCPTMLYQPKVRKVLEEFLNQVNAMAPEMPDGSGRIIRFLLKEKGSKLFAIDVERKGAIS